MVNNVKSVLIDLSGTLHIDNTVIPGAVDALNNRLTKLGFNITKEEIFSSLAAAREIVKTRKLNPLYLIEDDAMEDFKDLIDSTNQFNAVMVGLAPSKFDYIHLNEAFRLLMNGASLIAIHEGRYYKKSDGLAIGPGAFVKGLEYSSDVKAEVIGKPTSGFFKAALGTFLPEEAIMIGDDVNDDIAGAQAVGIKGFLVKTGKYQSGDENKIEPAPTKVCDSFTEAVDIIIHHYLN
ncbi:haloacid dehalogenase-like hydrolase domain-containing protein 2 isoform X2 [Phymastichus coffea]|uniref:haloacid dehalogenase-like hydrolase domain-containing protein 2 isoform X2 n=1 Tax=Phymastichus coffea TaxID=108790 RepID=UPI00273BC23F|nr:haloacid dehalogenase-like hydrolase domain-containing protein 2 isoform X2 [Phymastichus coffea]